MFCCQMAKNSADCQCYGFSIQKQAKQFSAAQGYITTVFFYWTEGRIPILQYD